MKIDETSIAIIKHLRNGRKSFNKIAEEMGITENTVRARVSNLQDEGVLEISGLVEPASIPRHSMVIVGCKLKNTDIVNKGEEFSKLKGVVSVSVVTGRYDLLITVLLKGEPGLLEFYKNEVSQIKGVQSCETFVVYKGFNQKVPYVL